MIAKQRRKARKFALQGLYQMSMSDTLPQDVENYLRQEAKPDQVDLAYLHKILFTVGQDFTRFDEQYAPFLDRDLEELTPIEMSILRLASYELLCEHDVPYKVVINEALELSKRYGADSAHKFINGVLDKLARKLRPLETGNSHG